MQAVCRVNHPAAGDGSKRLAAGDAKPAPAFHKSSAVVTTAMGQVTSAVQSSCERQGFWAHHTSGCGVACAQLNLAGTFVLAIAIGRRVAQLSREPPAAGRGVRAR
jgi:hypothetical protein